LPATAGFTCCVWIEKLLPPCAPSGTRIAAPPLTSSMSVPEKPWSSSHAGFAGTGCSKS
jgi:hypothetical protein